MTRRWHAVIAKPGCEFLAGADLFAAGIQVWVPWHYVNVIKGRVQSEVRRATFGRYFFTKIRDEQIGKVNQCRYVGEVLQAGGKPAPVPKRLMHALFQQAEGDYLDLTQAPEHPGYDFQAGDLVRFLEGPLEGREAQIISIADREVRMWVEFLGGKIEAKADPATIERVPEKLPSRGWKGKSRKRA